MLTSNLNLVSRLHQLFLDSPQYAKLLGRTARGAARTELNLVGLTDSAKSLVFSVLAHETRRPLILVVQDNHTGARYHQELSNLSRYPVFFYPSSEVSPYEQVLSSPDNIAAQLELLRHIMKGEKESEPYIAVVSARALSQRVLSKEQLERHSLSLKVGEQIDSTELGRRLAALGYSKEALVTLRGEFSIRGDIIDVFPSCGLPIRIELFGDEIESMRVFNIDSQRSIEPTDKISIPPRWWVVLSPDEKEREALADKLAEKTEEAAAHLSESAAETLKDVTGSDLEALRLGRYPESLEYYAPYIDEDFATLINFLPPSSMVVLDEWDTLLAALSSYDEKLDNTIKEGLETGRLLPLPRLLHLKAGEIATSLKPLQRLYVSTLPLVIEEEAPSPSQAAARVDFDCHPIERFGNQLNLLAERVKTLRKEGYHILICTEQPQRIIGVLKEYDCQAVYISPEGADTHISPEESKPAAGNTINPENLLGDLSTALGGSTARKEERDKIWVARSGFSHGFKLTDAGLVTITDAEIFGVKRKPTIYRRPIIEKNYERFTSVSDLKVGDYVVHLKHGIGQFVGIKRISIDSQQREHLKIQYSGDDVLYVPVDQINLLSRYRGAGDAPPRLSRFGGAEWETTKKRVKKSIKQVAEDLVNLYAMRAKQEGYQCPPDTPWQYEMEEAFPYEETPDQWQAIQDVKADLESPKPMDRLICGDVGFGKTEIAIRGIFKAVMSGKQVAVLVPTTILAQQHFNNISERFAPYPVRVGLLSRFRTAKEQREVAKKLATGECDVVIGTHRMLQKDIAFKDLGLVVIDEEQRFGVGHKEKLKQLRVMVDVLTMSATPIPRTLYMALSGARDMSTIEYPADQPRPHQDLCRRIQNAPGAHRYLARNGERRADLFCSQPR
jgi:transcription-repair coupling factor (superfamily II helicase)